MEKHQPNLLLSFFFHMIRGKKVYAYERQQFLYHMSKRGLSSMSSFSSTNSPKTWRLKKTTLEKVLGKERYERRERERERYTQEGKTNKFCCKSVFFAKTFCSRVYFLTTQIHKKLWALELFWGCWVGILRRDWRRRIRRRRRGKGAQIWELVFGVVQ